MTGVYKSRISIFAFTRSISNVYESWAKRTWRRTGRPGERSKRGRWHKNEWSQEQKKRVCAAKNILQKQSALQRNMKTKWGSVREKEIDRDENEEQAKKAIAMHIKLVVKFTRYGTLTTTWVVNTTRWMWHVLNCRHHQPHYKHLTIVDWFHCVAVCVCWYAEAIVSMYGFYLYSAVIVMVAVVMLLLLHICYNNRWRYYWYCGCSR